VNEDGKMRLEDRFDVVGLWMAESVRATWRDGAGNILSVARFDSCVPDDEPDMTRTRADFHSRQAKRPLGAKDEDGRMEAVYLSALAETSAPVKPRRSQRRNFVSLLEYPTTNELVRVFAFRPRCADRKANPPWFLVSVAFAQDTEDADDAFERFDEDFLDQVKAISDFPAEKPPTDERDLLFRAIRRNVANYSEWHFAQSGGVAVADDLPAQDREPFVASLTNDLPRLRKAFAESLPSPLSDSVNPAVVRAYAFKQDYLAHVGAEYSWTAALWAPKHRELSIYLPEGGGAKDLLATTRHEALHQYLDYACAMMQAAPWLNEGHAELFRNSHFGSEGEIVFDKPAEDAQFVQANADKLADLLPAMFMMDYGQFYDGSQEERRAKYRIAWSMAYFLEVGAPKVRFKPFKDLRRDYLRKLVETGSRAEAGRQVMTDGMVTLFVSEWRAFWKRQ